MDDNAEVSEIPLYNSDLEEKRALRAKRRKKIRLYVLGALCLLIAFFCIYNFTDIIYGLSEELTSDSHGNDWAMFGRDMGRTSSTGPGGEIPDGTLKWTFSTGAPVHSSPAIVEGTVYIGSRDYNVYAIDAETGEKKWEFNTGSWVESSPIVVDGIVYIGSNDGHMYALKADTGEKIWSFKAKFAVRSIPAIANGKIYFGADDYNVYALDAKTGKEIWRYRTDNYIQSSPVIYGGIACVSSVDGYYYSFNANNGKLRLKFNTKSLIVASPVVDEGVAYCIAANGWLYSIDIGAKNWPLEEKLRYYWNALYLYGVMWKPPAPSGYLWAEWLRDGSNSTPVLVGDTLYMGAGDRFVAFDVEKQELVWDFSAGERVFSSPAFENNTAYFGCENGNLYAVNAADGTELWHVVTGDKITSSPAISNGVVFIGSQDGNVYAYV